MTLSTCVGWIDDGRQTTDDRLPLLIVHTCTACRRKCRPRFIVRGPSSRFP